MNTMLLARIVAASTQRPVRGEHTAPTDPPRIAPASHGGLATIVVIWTMSVRFLYSEIKQRFVRRKSKGKSQMLSRLDLTFDL
jgi:hypothetical protein